MYRTNQALFVRFPYFPFLSLLLSFVAASFRPRRPRARCRAHRNDSVNFIRLQSPFFSPPLLASRIAYLYLSLSPGFGQAGNQAIIGPFSARVLSPRASHAVTIPLSRAFSLTRDRGLGPQIIPELT